MTPEDEVAATDSYRVHDEGRVQLGRTRFRIEVQVYTDGRRFTWLCGPRGSEYFLRPFLGPDDGLRQVVNARTGEVMRCRGNDVLVIEIGDVIELADECE